LSPDGSLVVGGEKDDEGKEEVEDRGGKEGARDPIRPPIWMS